VVTWGHYFAISGCSDQQPRLTTVERRVRISLNSFSVSYIKIIMTIFRVAEETTMSISAMRIIVTHAVSFTAAPVEHLDPCCC